MAKETYLYGKRDLMAKETYLYGKIDLFIWQKRPIYMAKRPIYMAKETQ